MAAWILILVAVVGVGVLVAFSFGRASGNADAEEQRLIDERRHALREEAERAEVTGSHDGEDDDDVEVMTGA